MNKLLTKIVGVALGATMAVGVGVAAVKASENGLVPTYAAESVYKTALFGSSYNSKGVSSYTASFSSTNDGFTVNLSNFNNNNNGWNFVKTGNKTNASVGTIVTDSAIDEAITKVVVTIDAVTTSNVNSITLYTSSDGSSYTSAGTFPVGTGGKYVTLSSPTTNLYYKIEFDCKKGGSNGIVTVSKVEFYHNTGSPIPEPSLVTDKSLSEFFADTAGNLKQRYQVTGYVSNWKSGETDGTEYGNLYLTEQYGTGTEYYIYGCTATSSAMSWDSSSGKYTFNNPKDFLTDTLTSTISIGSQVTMILTRCDYSGTLEGQGIVLSVVNPTTYTVTYSAGTYGTGSFAHTKQIEGNYTLLPFASLTGVSASSGYRFKDYTVSGTTKNPGDTISINADTSVTVNFEEKGLETTYVFATNFATYASSWTNSYAEKTVSGDGDVGGDYAATINFKRVAKMDSGVGSTKPYVCPNTSSDVLNLVFTLTETGYKIGDVTVTYEQRGSNTPTFKLFKGASASGTALDSATLGTKDTLSTTNLNDKSFSITGNANKSGNSGAGLTSIYISLVAESSFGTLDHIAVTSLPNTTLYHTGEHFASSGLTVTAYDNADESIASFKDVTSLATIALDDGDEITDSLIPYADIDVEYTENGVTKETSFRINVYALMTYELVSEEQTDWSGNYLITGVFNENIVAMNSVNDPFDVVPNFKETENASENTVDAGQECEFTISSVTGGYAIQGKNGKYIGWEGAADKNGLTTSETPLVNTISFSEGNVVIQSSVGHQLKLNTASGQERFRFYGSGGSVRLYKLSSPTPEYTAADFAKELLKQTKGLCNADYDGEDNHDALAAIWSTLSGSNYWGKVSNQSALTGGTADSSVVVPTTDTEIDAMTDTAAIGAALYRYDFCTDKYKLTDFMGRVDGTNRINPINKVNNTVAIVVVVTISLVSVSALGAYFLLRKKKEER